MATVQVLYGDNYTKQETPKSTNIIAPGVWGGRVRVQVDEYTTAAGADPGDVGSTLYMGKLPAGATYLGSDIISAALGATLEMSLGDGTTVDLFMLATVCHSNTVEARLTIGTKYAAITKLILTTSVVALAAEQKIIMITYYTQD